MPAKPVKVQLDREREICYDQRAEFRMSSLDRPFEVSDMSNKRKSWGALVAWLWACLSNSDAAAFPLPEDLAQHVTAERIGPAFASFMQTWRAAQQPPEKNADSLTTSHSASLS